jgi:hypothetical protein
VENKASKQLWYDMRRTRLNQEAQLSWSGFHNTGSTFYDLEKEIENYVLRFH